ncbi:hypothetical protein INT43_007371 [Umbelopsis isabellina]|uniref:protein-tyrosine-phosphatase n=1 Tax=Mortierella isabellina TaxID=91625 RepID=A0A8H7PYG6_MORIS|nr:hypothetical protein INT43_007371 [Umbelopsis isabellina]
MTNYPCAAQLGQGLSIIDVPDCPIRFLILTCPTDNTLPLYLSAFKELKVTDVVRCCDPTYSTEQLEDLQIKVLDIPFKDGSVPSKSVVHDWLQLFQSRQLAALPVSANSEQRPTIAVHCVAGLGRAPVLVAIALIEMGMQPLDAIEFIRQYRRGTFNRPQIAYLDGYKRTRKRTANSSESSLSYSLKRMFSFGKELSSH